MPTYRFHVRVANDAMLLRLQRLMMLRSTVLSMEIIPDTHESAALPIPPTEEEAPGDLHEATVERDMEIINKYLIGDTTAANLALEYGISRERVCQILRRSNIIEHVRERKAAVRGAYDDVRKEMTEQARAEFNKHVEDGLALLREGKSIRQAQIQLGYPAHSHFGAILSKMAKAQKIVGQHGRHRDMSTRRQRVCDLSALGLSVPQIVKKMRAENDPHIYEQWIYKYMSECKIAGDLHRSEEEK